MVQHNMDDLSCLKDEESNGWRDSKTPQDFMSTVRILNADNERLMRGNS
jgi:hypothetical protein